MALTPMDIYNKEFSKGFRGYDEEEVDMFLDQVVDEYEKLQKENAAADEKIQSLNERLEHYRSLEGTLKETLVTAQNTAEEVVENARKKAALIIDSAQREARDIVDKAASQIEQVEKMDMELRKAAAVFKSRFVALLEAQLEFFHQETADINAQRSKTEAAAEAQADDSPEPEAPMVFGEEPGFAVTAEAEANAPAQEPVEPMIPLQEREEPLTPTKPEEPADTLQEREEPLAEDKPEEPADTLQEREEYFPAQPPEQPIASSQEGDGYFTPVQSPPADSMQEREEYFPAKTQEASSPEPVSGPEQQEAAPYMRPDQPSTPVASEPKDTEEEAIDDADALIREIQHYSALRNDEDTVSDEGFIIGRDD